VLSVVCGVCGVWCVACKGYVGGVTHTPQCIETPNFASRHLCILLPDYTRHSNMAAMHTTQSAVRSHAKEHNINCKVAEGQCVHAELCGCTTEAESTSTSTVMVDSAWSSLAVWCRQWSENDGGIRTIVALGDCRGSLAVWCGQWRHQNHCGVGRLSRDGQSGVYGGASDDETTTTTADAKRLRTQLNVGMASSMLCVVGHSTTPPRNTKLDSTELHIRNTAPPFLQMSLILTKGCISNDCVFIVGPQLQVQVRGREGHSGCCGGVWNPDGWVVSRLTWSLHPLQPHRGALTHRCGVVL
jgi:hypothetical protein